jgi:hypothetical protein
MLKISARLLLGTIVTVQVAAPAFGKSAPPALANAGRDRYGDRSQQLFKDEDLNAEESPEEPREFTDLNAGLPQQIERNLGLKADRNYIVLLKKSPEYVFDFRSADRLRRSMMTMNTGSMDLGHAMVAWQCRNGQGGMDRGATGQTGESQGQGLKMIRSGWGLSTFMSSFSDGYLNTSKEVEKIIDEANGLNRLRFLAFEVSQTECTKMLNFLKTYIRHPNHPQQHFGLNLRPDKFEGGGCGSFAVTLLEQAGAFKSLTPNIWRILDVPTHLLGVGDQIPPYTDFYKQIPYQQSVFSGSLMSDYWACRPGWAACHKLRIADPEMIIHLISSLEKAAAQLLGPRDVMFGEAGMKLSSKVRVSRFFTDTMDRSIELDSQVVDANYDQRAANMEAAGLAYLRHHLSRGGKLYSGRLLNTPGLIFERGRRP